MMDRTKSAVQQHARAKRYRERHRERNLARLRKWREDNHDKAIAWLRDYRRANPERHRTEVREWQKRNPEKRRAQRHLRKCRQRSAEGRFTGIDIKNILKHQRNKCAYYIDCGQSFSNQQFQIDHIVPLARGGTNWPNNLQLLCASCNARKHDRDPIDYACQQGRML